MRGRRTGIAMCNESLHSKGPKANRGFGVGKSRRNMLFQSTPKTLGAAVVLMGVGGGEALQVSSHATEGGKRAVCVNTLIIGLHEVNAGSVVRELADEGGEVREVLGAAVLRPACVHMGEAGGIINKTLEVAFATGS